MQNHNQQATMPNNWQKRHCCEQYTCDSSNSPPYLQKRVCGHCGADCDKCVFNPNIIYRGMVL